MRNKIGYIILSSIILLVSSLIFLLLINYNIFDLIKAFFVQENIVLDSPVSPEILRQLKNSTMWQKIAEIVTVIFTLTIIFTATIIVLENRNPSKTIAWLMVLTFLPVIGFIFYIFFGRNFRKWKKIKGKEIVNVRIEEIIERQFDIVSNCKKLWETSSERRLVKLVLNNSKAPFTLNNSAKVLTNGEETFSEIIKELRKAKDHIHLEYYIIQDDNIGNKIKDILIKKAQEGVEVRVIYDGVGSRKLSVKYISQLKNAGVKVKCFLPVLIPFLNSKINYRNHRKIIVVDGKVGFVGGLNIGDEYLGRDPKMGFWRDTHLKLRGNSVHFLQNIFINDWDFVKGDKIEGERYFPEIEQCGNTIVQIASSGFDSDWEAILQAYFAAIASAEEKIYITTPYLIPDDSILMALKTAALSGVDVRILVPGKPDKKIVFWASHSYFEELLEAGVKIYKYQKGFIHAKILIADDTVSSIGSANMDIRSFELSTEVNALLYDVKIYKRLERDFLKDLEDSKQLSLEEFRKRPIFARFRESAARLFSPLL